MFRRGVILFTFGAGAIATAVITPPNLFEAASSTIATFAGFFAAAVVPTMMLAATILRPTTQEVGRFRKVRVAVRHQLDVFGGMLLLAVLLVALVAIGEITGWSSRVITIPLWDLSVDAIWLLNSSIMFLSLLLLSRFPAFLDGVFSLYELHADGVEAELVARIEAAGKQVAVSNDLPADPRSDFGKELSPGEIVPVKH